MRSFYFVRPVAKGLAAVVLCVCGVAAVVAPQMESKEALRLVESLNDKLVRANELYHNNLN